MRTVEPHDHPLTTVGRAGGEETGPDGRGDLSPSGDDLNLSSAMTVIVGIAARDGCVLVGDRMGLDWANQTKRENVEKLYKIGRNVAVGVAGSGDTTTHYLSEAGYIGSDEVFKPSARADQVANLLRKAFLGKVLSPQWWEGEEERIQHLGKPFNHDPQMHTLIAGFDEGPTLCYIDQKAAFVPGNSQVTHGIGIPHWTNPLLPHIYPGKAADHSLEEAIRAALFAAYLTTRMSPFAGGGFDVMTVTAEGVVPLPFEDVNGLVSTADRVFRKWIRAAS